MSSAAGVRRNASPLAMENAIVHIVDDEAALRGAISRLLRAHGFQTAVMRPVMSSS